MVTLVSGGLDSTLMAVMAKEEGILQYPLFIDYGQINRDKEWSACLLVHEKNRLPKPSIMDLKGFGALVPSGLTDSTLRVNEDAFLPNRNLLFLMVGSSYAYIKGAKVVSIGLLSEEFHIFPDQTKTFILKAQEVIRLSLGYQITVIAPLMDFSKQEIMALAKDKGVFGTYSCHLGGEIPCGTCISCMETKGGG